MIGERFVRVGEPQRAALGLNAKLVTNEAVADDPRIAGDVERLCRVHLDALHNVDRVRDGERRGAAGDARLAELFIDTIRAELPVVTQEVRYPVVLNDDDLGCMLIVVRLRRRT